MVERGLGGEACGVGCRLSIDTHTCLCDRTGTATRAWTTSSRRKVRRPAISVFGRWLSVATYPLKPTNQSPILAIAQRTPQPSPGPSATRARCTSSSATTRSACCSSTPARRASTPVRCRFWEFQSRQPFNVDSTWRPHICTSTYQWTRGVLRQDADRGHPAVGRAGERAVVRDVPKAGRRLILIVLGKGDK